MGIIKLARSIEANKRGPTPTQNDSDQRFDCHERNDPMPRIQMMMLILATTMLLGGCRKEQSTESPESTKPQDSTQNKKSDANEDDLKAFLNRDKPAAANPAALPSGHPPIDGGRAPQPATNADGLPAGHPPIPSGKTPPKQGLPPLDYKAPEGWQEHPPSRAFRAAEFTIPRAEGDAEDGQLIVYYFGPGQGGGIEDNLARWRSMFSTADGQPVADDAASHENFEANGLAVTTIDVQGRYADMMSRPNQSGPTTEHYRLLGAIVETPDGNWFFKGVGPANTMSANRDGFMEMLKAIRRP